jgi:hypothetical protein
MIVTCLKEIRESRLCAQLYLLLGIHFITHQFGDVAHLIQSTLKLNISFIKDGSKAIGSIISESIFREEDVAQCAPQLPIIDRLSARTADSLSISCAYHLLKGKVFTYVG